MSFRKLLAPALAVLGLVIVHPPARLSAQSSILFQLQSGSVLSDRFRADSSGAFVAFGFVRDVVSGSGCAAQVPATGAGTRLEWHPCRGALRFGRVTGTQWDDASMNDFTFAGGTNVTASGLGS